MLGNFWLEVVMSLCIPVFFVRLCFIILGNTVPSFLQVLNCTQTDLPFKDVKLCFGQVREQSVVWDYIFDYSYQLLYYKLLLLQES